MSPKRPAAVTDILGKPRREQLHAVLSREERARRRGRVDAFDNVPPHPERTRIEKGENVTGKASLSAQNEPTLHLKGGDRLERHLVSSMHGLTKENPDEKKLRQKEMFAGQYQSQDGKHKEEALLRNLVFAAAAYRVQSATGDFQGVHSGAVHQRNERMKNLRELQGDQEFAGGVVNDQHALFSGPRQEQHGYAAGSGASAVNRGGIDFAKRLQKGRFKVQGSKSEGDRSKWELVRIAAPTPPRWRPSVTAQGSVAYAFRADASATNTSLNYHVLLDHQSSLCPSPPTVPLLGRT